MMWGPNRRLVPPWGVAAFAPLAENVALSGETKRAAQLFAVPCHLFSSVSDFSSLAAR